MDPNYSPGYSPEYWGAYSSEQASDYQQYYTSQPLIRDESSGGSSYASSDPMSPMMSHHQHPGWHGGNPYTQQQQWEPAPHPDSSHQNPSSSKGRGHHNCCLSPGCTSKPFKRPADLDRHYKQCHANEEQKKSFNRLCDYWRCTKANKTFRQDHYRDHLRDFHKEDIEKRGAPNINEEELDNSNVDSSWWRCRKCLCRVSVAEDGFECPNCESSCLSERRRVRRS